MNGKRRRILTLFADFVVCKLPKHSSIEHLTILWCCGVNVNSLFLFLFSGLRSLKVL
jgi:hypothetical protein